MRKKILSLMLVLAIAVTSLTACQQEKKEPLKDEGTKIEENAWSYDYYQELNVVDDNYRNYYEIFVYSFCDSNGDGIGDLQGVISKLDYIKYMGFNGIWFMPIMPSTTYHKYDVTNYTAIDPQYGTMEDFDKLVEECHARGINVVIDFVINHSSSKHPWFTEACNYLRSLDASQTPSVEECKYLDYYHFSTEKEYDKYYQVPGTKYYYEGAFWDQMPDLNLESEAVRAELTDIAKFWIDKGVDGFRVDAALHFAKGNTSKNNEIMNWLYTTCTKMDPDFYMVSEVWDNLLVITDHYGSKTPSMFNFDAAQQSGKILRAARGYDKASAFIDTMMSYDERFSEKNPDYIDALFLSNHDLPRLSEMAANNEKYIKVGMGFMMMMNGSTYVYYGDEIGLQGASDKDENKRLPMNWSDADATGETNGPAGCNKTLTSKYEALDEQLKDGNSIANYIRHAIRLRNENPEIARGEMKKIDSLCVDYQAVITKTYEDSTIAIAYNNSDEPIEINIKDSEISGMKIRGYLTLDGEVVTLKNGVLTLPAKGFCVLK